MIVKGLLRAYVPKVLGIWLLIIICAVTPGAYGAQNDLGTSIANLAQLVTRQFGVTEARVAAVQGDTVYLNAGSTKYIKEGTLFEIVAEGAPVTDPTTRARIGTIETHVADVKIISVRTNLCIGQVISKGQSTVATVPLAVGQKAVEKARKFSIAVVPFEYLNSKDGITARVAQELMINELIKTGRFVVADSLRTEQLVKMLSATSTPGSVKFTKEAGKLLGVSYVMYGYLTDLPGFTEIQCRVHDSRTGAGVVAGSVQQVPPAPQPVP